MLSIHDRNENLQLYIDQVTAKIARVIDFSNAHQVMETTSRQWQESDTRETHQRIAHLCEDIAGHVLRIGSPQESLFAFQGFTHRPLFRTNHNRDHKLVDIVYGISTRLGDGGRYDDRDGGTSFDQRKGTRTRSVHFYIQNVPK